FELEYPAFELIFVAPSDEDPGLDVARRLAARHPQVPVRWARPVLGFGKNPKVSQLEGALRMASHDLVLQTDANVRVPRDYLRRIVSEFLSQGASLLSSLVVGKGEASLGAAVENIQLSAVIAPGCCFALRAAQVPCVVGKSMLFRQSELKAIGGFEIVKDVLAEDFLLGDAFRRAGKKVVISATPIANINVHAPLSHFLKRHARWLQMRAVIHPPAFLGDLLANPFPFALLGMIGSGFALKSVLWSLLVLVFKTTTDRWLLRLTRGEKIAWKWAIATPIHDMMLFFLFFYAACVRKVEWRGLRFRLGKGSLLKPLLDSPPDREPPLPTLAQAN
ncbi:MAG: glycosyltransferase, partial [Sandaracinaceae bacterium]|nr:glycosyltransferase [Sandaracinaceae bacterium]